MADETIKSQEQLTEEERQRLALQLSQDIARKYDASRLSKIVVTEAGRGERLDVATRSEMEKKVGGQFGDVRVFRGAFAEAITKQHRADAVTVANTGMILVREGPRSDPKTAKGKALLAHELTHVRQAQQGLHFALEGGHQDHAPHEVQAAAVEAKVHAEASGQPAEAAAQHDAAAAAAARQAIKARALELWHESHRLRRERLGLD